jgi:hypothetical protein
VRNTDAAALPTPDDEDEPGRDGLSGSFGAKDTSFDGRALDQYVHGRAHEKTKTPAQIAGHVLQIYELEVFTIAQLAPPEHAERFPFFSIRILDYGSKRLARAPLPRDHGPPMLRSVGCPSKRRAVYL